MHSSDALGIRSDAMVRESGPVRVLLTPAVGLGGSLTLAPNYMYMYIIELTPTRSTGSPMHQQGNQTLSHNSWLRDSWWWN